MKRLKVSEEYPFGVLWRSYPRYSRRWMSVHKTRGSAELAAEVAADKYPKKRFIVWEWQPNLKAAFPVS